MMQFLSWRADDSADLLGEFVEGAVAQPNHAAVVLAGLVAALARAATTARRRAGTDAARPFLRAVPASAPSARAASARASRVEPFTSRSAAATLGQQPLREREVDADAAPVTLP